MTRYLLDTNIISNVTKPAPSDALLAWMAEQADDDLFISVADRRGNPARVLEKPAGKETRGTGSLVLRAGRSASLVRRPRAPVRRKGGPHLGAADGRRHGQGRPRSALDMIIAAVAEANDCVVVTDNEKDFAGLKFINPLRS